MADNFEGVTDPYGILEYAIGSGDDFHCFDYACYEDDEIGKTLILHSVVNSETGSFIMTVKRKVIPLKEETFEAEIMDLVDDAVTWLADNDVKHDKVGWNQDWYYFYRHVASSCMSSLGKAVPCFSDRQYRLGGKKINKFFGLEGVK